jgi:hypothetical protein
LRQLAHGDALPPLRYSVIEIQGSIIALDVALSFPKAGKNDLADANAEFGQSKRCLPSSEAMPVPFRTKWLFLMVAPPEIFAFGGMNLDQCSLRKSIGAGGDDGSGHLKKPDVRQQYRP